MKCKPTWTQNDKYTLDHEQPVVSLDNGACYEWHANRRPVTSPGALSDTWRAKSFNRCVVWLHHRCVRNGMGWQNECRLKKGAGQLASREVRLRLKITEIQQTWSITLFHVHPWECTICSQSQSTWSVIIYDRYEYSLSWLFSYIAQAYCEVTQWSKQTNRSRQE